MILGLGFVCFDLSNDELKIICFVFTFDLKMIEVNVKIYFSVCFGEQLSKRYSIFISIELNFEFDRSKFEYILTVLQEALCRGHCKKSTLAFGDCFATFFGLFTFQLKRKFYSLAPTFTVSSEKFGFAFAKFTSTSSRFTLYKKWLFLNLVCLQPRLVFPPTAYCFTYIYLFVFFLRFFLYHLFVVLFAVNFYVNVCVSVCYLSH